MDSKAFFIRDGRTTIPVIAIQLNPTEIVDFGYGDMAPAICDGQRLVLAAAGYGKSAEEQARKVMMLDLTSELAEVDPLHWALFPLKAAHLWTRQNFDAVRDGMTLDVTAWRERMDCGDYGWQNEAAKGAKA